MKSFIASALLTWIFALPRVSAASLDEWNWRNPFPQGNPLYNVTYINGNWVSVGELGTLLFSTNGTNWISRQSDVQQTDLHGCAFGSGVYVVVGDFGTVLTSSDGISWTQRFTGTFYSLKSVTYAAGKFSAVGETPSTLTSPDGINWTSHSSGNWVLNDVLRAQGFYVAVGGNSQGSVVLHFTGRSDLDSAPVCGGHRFFNDCVRRCKVCGNSKSIDMDFDGCSDVATNHVIGSLWFHSHLLR